MKNTQRTSRQDQGPSAASSRVNAVVTEEDSLNEHIHAAKGSYDTDLIYSLELAGALEIGSQGIRELSSPLSD